MAQRSQQDIAYHSKRCSLQIEVFLRNAVIRIITMPVCLPLDFGTATLKEVTPSPSADAATPGSKQGSLLQVTTVEIAGDSLSAPKRVTQGGYNLLLCLNNSACRTPNTSNSSKWYLPIQRHRLYSQLIATFSFGTHSAVCVMRGVSGERLSLSACMFAD